VSDEDNNTVTMFETVEFC